MWNWFLGKVYKVGQDLFFSLHGYIIELATFIENNISPTALHGSLCYNKDELICASVFLSFLLRYKPHTTQFTHLKCINQYIHEDV